MGLWPECGTKNVAVERGPKKGTNRTGDPSPSNKGLNPDLAAISLPCCIDSRGHKFGVRIFNGSIVVLENAQLGQGPYGRPRGEKHLRKKRFVLNFFQTRRLSWLRINCHNNHLLSQRESTIKGGGRNVKTGRKCRPLTQTRHDWLVRQSA